VTRNRFEAFNGGILDIVITKMVVAFSGNCLPHKHAEPDQELNSHTPALQKTKTALEHLFQGRKLVAGPGFEPGTFRL